MAHYKILLVEDNQDDARVLRSILRKGLDCDVVIAVDGEQAIRSAETLQPDLTLLDIQLPVLNGFQVLEELKKRQIATRVIMLSGFKVDIETAVKAIKAGACDYLTKPVDSYELIEHIKRGLLTESTINLRLPFEMPGLVDELIRLEMRIGTRFLRARREADSESRDEGSGLSNKIQAHWLPILVSLSVAVAAATWAIATNVAISPRDFEIQRLQSIIDQQKPDAEPSPSAFRLPETSPTTASTPNQSP